MTPERKLKTIEADVEGEPEQNSLAHYVYNQLRQEIRSQQLRSNVRLRETDIARRMNVSRTPVREALKRLEAEGMASFAPPSGFVVAQLSLKQVMDLYAIRKVLLGAAAYFAAGQASIVEVLSMRQVLENLGRTRMPDEAAALSRRIEEIIVQSAHNGYLEKTTSIVCDAFSLLTTTTYSTLERINSVFGEYTEIVTCIERHDAKDAQCAAHAHIESTIKFHLKVLFGHGNTVADDKQGDC